MRWLLANSGARVPSQLRKLREPSVLGFGLLQDGDVGVGVFPEREEVLVGGAGFGGVAGEGVGASEAQVGQRADDAVQDYAAMVEDFLEFGGGFTSLLGGAVGFGAHIDLIQVCVV